MATKLSPRVALFRLSGESATFVGLVDKRSADKRSNVAYTTIRAALAFTRQSSPNGLVPGAVVDRAIIGRGVFTTSKAVHEHREAINAEQKLANKALKLFRAINQL